MQAVCREAQQARSLPFYSYWHHSAKWLQVQQGKEGGHIKRRKAQHENLERVLMHGFGNRTARGASTLNKLALKQVGCTCFQQK